MSDTTAIISVNLVQDEFNWWDAFILYTSKLHFIFAIIKCHIWSTSLSGASITNKHYLFTPKFNETLIPFGTTDSLEASMQLLKKNLIHAH